MKKLVVICLITGLFLPLVALGEIERPQNLEEAKGFSLDIIKQLPGAVKRAWQEEVLPLWQKLWEWLKAQLQKLWNWILRLLGKEVEKVKSGAKEKQEEIQRSLWQKFKDLFK